MKKGILLRVLLIFLILPSIALITYAHPGRTDSNGGHTDHSTGEYHYHHGYSAHDHYDMDGDGDIDCPYDFDDKADHRSDAGQSVKEASSQKKESTFDWGGIIDFGMTMFFIFVLLFLIYLLR